MPFALILLAILILVIAITSCPGFVGFMLVLGISAVVITLAVAYFKTKRDLKENQKLLDEIPPQPWDDEL